LPSELRVELDNLVLRRQRRDSVTGPQSSRNRTGPLISLGTRRTAAGFRELLRDTQVYPCFLLTTLPRESYGTRAPPSLSWHREPLALREAFHFGLAVRVRVEERKVVSDCFVDIIS
jgi:hypothetical protein